MKSISITLAKNELSQIILAVELGDPVELTRHGKAAAVLVSASEYKKLIQLRLPFSLAYDSFRERNPEISDSGNIFENIRNDNPGRDVEL